MFALLENAKGGDLDRACFNFICEAYSVKYIYHVYDQFKLFRDDLSLFISTKIILIFTFAFLHEDRELSSVS